MATLAIVIVASKGAISFVQDWASYFWWLDYGHGLIRRGLAGQVFQWLLGTLSQKALFVPLMTLSVVWIGLLALALVIPFARVITRVTGRARLLFLMAAAPLFVSQLWPTLTFTEGYLDPLLLLLAAGVPLCLRKGWTLGAVGLAVAGPVIHEFFVFLLPFMLVAALDETALAEGADELQTWEAWAPTASRVRWPLVIVAGASLTSLAAIILFSSHDASAAQFADMPLSADLKAKILATSMNQSLREALQRMLDYIGAEPGFAFFNLLFFLAPALAASIGLIAWRTSRANPIALLQAAAGLVPAAAILVAWDLSRFLVITTFTSGALFLWAAERRTRPAAVSLSTANDERPSSTLKAAVAAVLVLSAAYGLYPFTYTYFGYRSFFQYFPPQALRERMYRSHLAAQLEAIWGHQDDDFADKDVTCRLQPAAAPGGGCLHPLKTGEWIYGPYIQLSKGRYRASVRIASPLSCHNPLRFEATNMRQRTQAVATTEFLSGPAAQATLNFPVDLDLAHRGDFEFRTQQLAGETCAAVDQVLVRRLGP